MVSPPPSEQPGRGEGERRGRAFCFVLKRFVKSPFTRLAICPVQVQVHSSAGFAPSVLRSSAACTCRPTPPESICSAPKGGPAPLGHRPPAPGDHHPHVRGPALPDPCPPATWDAGVCPASLPAGGCASSGRSGYWSPALFNAPCSPPSSVRLLLAAVGPPCLTGEGPGSQEGCPAGPPCVPGGRAPEFTVCTEI